MLAFQLFNRYLMSRRSGAVVRTVSRLSLLSVIVGISALIVVMCVMNGFNESIHKKLLAVEPHMVVTVPGVRTARAVEQSEVFLFVKSQSELTSFPFELHDIIIRTNDGFFAGAAAKGLDIERLKGVVLEADKINLGGRALFDMPLDFLREPNEIVVGSDLARSLSILEGDSVTLVSPESLLLPAGEIPNFERAYVRKIISTNIAEIDGNTVFYVRGQGFKRLTQSSSLSAGIEIETPDPYRLSQWTQLITDRGGHVASWVERNSALFRALRLEKIAIGLFLSLSAFIASFSLATVLTMLLAQKRRELGLLTALGLSVRRLQTTFFQVGLLFSGIGILVGFFLGSIIALGIDRFKVPLLPDIYYDQTIPSKFDPWFMALLFCGALIVSVIASILPTWQSTRGFNASHALRAIKSK